MTVYHQGQPASVPSHGLIVRWTSGFGESQQSAGVSECATEAEANEFGWAYAERAGWTPRRWWQFWRWDDTPNPAESKAK